MQASVMIQLPIVTPDAKNLMEPKNDYFKIYVSLTEIVLYLYFVLNYHRIYDSYLMNLIRLTSMNCKSTRDVTCRRYRTVQEKYVDSITVASSSGSILTTDSFLFQEISSKIFPWKTNYKIFLCLKCHIFLVLSFHYTIEVRSECHLFSCYKNRLPNNMHKTVVNI